MAAVAAPRAARRANSRRENGLSVGGIGVTSQRVVQGQREATESGVMGQLGLRDRFHFENGVVQSLSSTFPSRFRPYFSGLLLRPTAAPNLSSGAAACSVEPRGAARAAYCRGAVHRGSCRDTKRDRRLPPRLRSFPPSRCPISYGRARGSRAVRLFRKRVPAG